MEMFKKFNECELTDAIARKKEKKAAMKTERRGRMREQEYKLNRIKRFVQTYPTTVGFGLAVLSVPLGVIPTVATTASMIGFAYASTTLIGRSFVRSMLNKKDESKDVEFSYKVDLYTRLKNSIMLDNKAIDIIRELRAILRARHEGRVFTDPSFLDAFLEKNKITLAASNKRVDIFADKAVVNDIVRKKMRDFKKLKKECIEAENKLPPAYRSQIPFERRYIVIKIDEKTGEEKEVVKYRPLRWRKIEEKTFILPREKKLRAMNEQLKQKAIKNYTRGTLCDYALLGCVALTLFSAHAMALPTMMMHGIYGLGAMAFTASAALTTRFAIQTRLVHDMNASLMIHRINRTKNALNERYKTEMGSSRYKGLVNGAERVAINVEKTIKHTSIGKMCVRAQSKVIEFKKRFKQKTR